MRSIFWKEWNQLFSSLTAYIAIAVFLMSTALLTFVLPESSLFTYGLANLDPFFDTAPYVLLFLIPAFTMGLIAEERSNQSLELLLTKPLTITKVVIGKYLAAIALLFAALIPTLTYVFIVGQLAEPINNIDFGGIWGSYIGLFLLGASFTAIGIFASSISNNQIIAFVVALFLCFSLYFIFTSLSQLPWFFGKIDYFLQQLGIEYHYTSMSRGVLLFSDIIYFLSVIIFFLVLSHSAIKNLKK